MFDWLLHLVEFALGLVTVFDSVRVELLNGEKD